MRLRMARALRPVFIIGSYRSATSALTWALGQHPNLFPLEETHFLYKLAVDIENLYELGNAPGEQSFLGLSGFGAPTFRRYFGQAVDRMVSDARKPIIRRSDEIGEKDPSKLSDNVKLRRGWWQPKRRWVDGTPENAHFVLPLLGMFPDARFIHVLRNPRRVATSLMHFSTMGSFDYEEEVAYRTWTRLVRASALAEQAFGPDRVLRLAHDDLASSPRDALTACLNFIGESFHPDCLLPLREKINSSQYSDVGDCSIEANLASPSPWIREAFELYQRLTTGQGVVDGGAEPARAILEHELFEYRQSLKPATNELLSNENVALRQKVAELEREQLRLLRKLGASEHPMEIVDWGPQDIRAGVPFNPQHDGSSALWIRTRNARMDTQVVLEGVHLHTDVHANGDLVTAIVPPNLTAKPQLVSMHLYSADCEETTPPVTLTIDD